MITNNNDKNNNHENQIKMYQLLFMANKRGFIYLNYIC